MASGVDDWVEDELTFALEGEEDVRHRYVERCNLLNMLKISIKALINTSMRLGRSLNDDHPKLQQFLILMEHILRHRLKSRRSLLGQKKSFWGVIESFEKTSSEFAEGVMNVRSLPGVKTMVGRGRAWLRFVLMQKKLSDNFRTIVENRHTLTDWYEPQAVMLNEEGVVISGLLMGLNCIDYNVLLRGEEFDKSLGVIDFSQYLRDGNYLGKPAGQEEDDEESGLSQLLDQKAYLEELNRKLESSMETLQGKLVLVEKENTEYRDKVKSFEDNLTELSLERDSLRTMNERSSADLRRALECLQEDQKTELDTYLQTRAGLNQLYSASQKTLGTEQKLRQQLEQELELQKNARKEKETALQLLETSVHEKQDTIIGLRKQMEELKSANLKMHSQIKVANETHHRDSLKIRSLEAKLSQLTAHTKTLEKQLSDTKSRLGESEKTLRDLGGKMEEVQLARSSAENDLAIEKQWRAALQMEIQREKDRVVELTNETKKFKSLKKENAELQEKYSALQETVSDQEIAMVEMGRQLSLSQQKVSQMKEVNTMMKESVWVDDRSITDCQSCNKPFSVAKRKHHCRNCGGVFCYACSENSLQLASSSKPVRVCDSCYALLLERAST